MLQAMEMAADIQTKLLPSELPEIHRYELAVSLQYAELAGGDYYDFIPLTTDNAVSSKWLIVIGDVTGHGVSAALLVAWLRATVRALARECQDDLQALITKLNASMMQDMNTGKFVTLFLAVLDNNNNQIIWISAGHDPARLYTGDEPPKLLEACGPPVGVIAGAQWEATESLTLEDNDRLLIVTDGLQDAKNASGNRLGLEKIDSALQESTNVSVKTIKHHVVDDLDKHIQGTPLADDVTFLIIKREA
jgi:sigma-B regulation protein RsbU (phosphoserine phosphatase)